MSSSSKEFLDLIQAAIKNEEHEKVLSILTGEIGAMMAANKLALVRVVNRSGVEMPEDVSDEQLASVISSGIINKNEKFLTNLIEAIVAEKETHSNFIGLIIKAVGAVVKGISDSVAAGQRAQAEKKVAQESIKKEEQELRRAKKELTTGILGAKSKSTQAKFEIEAKKQKEAGEQDKNLKIALGVAGLSLLGVAIFIGYKKYSSNA